MKIDIVATPFKRLQVNLFNEYLFPFLLRSDCIWRTPVVLLWTPSHGPSFEDPLYFPGSTEAQNLSFVCLRVDEWLTAASVFSLGS